MSNKKNLRIIVDVQIPEETKIDSVKRISTEVAKFAASVALPESGVNANNYSRVQGNVHLHDDSAVCNVCSNEAAYTLSAGMTVL